MTKELFILFYLMVELSTSRLGTSIFVESQTVDTLSRAETIGYVSSGIGISILIVRSFFKKSSLFIKVFTFTLTYIMSIHLLHKSMESLPSYLSAENKQNSVVAGTNILLHHSPIYLYDAYSNEQHSLHLSDAIEFTLKFGGTDEELRSWMTDGIYQAALFSTYWSQLNKTMDKHKISSLIAIQQQKSALEFKLRPPKKIPEGFIFFENLFGTHIPNDYLVSEIIQKKRAWDEKTAAWIGVSKKFPYLRAPDSGMPISRWAEFIRTGFSRHSLEQYPVQVIVPWSGEAVYDENYERIIREIVPFFYSSKGNPLLDLALLRDPLRRHVFVKELEKPLSPVLQKLMNAYQVNNLIQLQAESSSWENPIRSAPGISLVRLVWFIPFLTILSYCLFLANFRIAAAELHVLLSEKFKIHVIATYGLTLLLIVCGSLVITSTHGLRIIDKILPWIGPNPLLIDWI